MEQANQVSEIDSLTEILQSEATDEEKIDLFLDGKASFERRPENRKSKTRYQTWYDSQTDTCCVIARKRGVTFAYIASGTPPELNSKKPWTIENVREALAGNITTEKTLEPVEQIPLAICFLKYGISYEIPKGARSISKKKKKMYDKLIFWPYEAPENHESKSTWFSIPEDGPIKVEFVKYCGPKWVYK